jgi:hypothetical protein
MSTESCLLKIGLDRFLELDGQNGQSSNFRHDHEIQPEKLGVRDCGAFGAMGFLEDGNGVAGCLRVLAGYWSWKSGWTKKPLYHARLWGEGKTFGGLRPKKGQVNKWIDTAT